MCGGTWTLQASSFSFRDHLNSLRDLGQGPKVSRARLYHQARALGPMEKTGRTALLFFCPSHLAKADVTKKKGHRNKILTKHVLFCFVFKE